MVRNRAQSVKPLQTVQLIIILCFADLPNKDSDSCPWAHQTLGQVTRIAPVGPVAPADPAFASPVAPADPKIPADAAGSEIPGASL
jgi:hypothetical protein